MKEYPSIFTQVLGPVGPGPSSSSTCGVARVGYMAYQVFGGIPKRAVILLPRAGKFPEILQGSRSDLALITGLLGRSQRHPRFLHAYHDAEQAGMDLRFEEVDWDCTGTCQMLGMDLTSPDGLHMLIVGDSTGGGTCLIRRIDGCPIEIRGDQYEILLFTGSLTQAQADRLMERCSAYADPLNEILWHRGEGGGIVQMKMGNPLSEEAVAAIRAMPEVKLLRVINPVHPVVVNRLNHPPFDSPEEMEGYCNTHGCSLWEAAVRYETALSGWTEQRVLDDALELWGLIKESIERGFTDGLDLNGIMTPKAGQLREAFSQPHPLSLGILDQALPVALAVMEYSNATGTIVYLPTGGSSGIVPAALYGAQQAYGATDLELAKALLAGGLIGVLMAKENNFSGSQYGCQAEISCAAAIASGCLMQFAGGTARQACDAASMVLQSMLGLVCDPVAGLVQVPCLTRNITATSIAFTCVNAVLAGFDPVIPLSDMVGALRETGRMMVNCGMNNACGACSSPTGRRLAEEQKERDSKFRADED